MAAPPEPYGPCPCGSGRKYKFCCRARDQARGRRQQPWAGPPAGPSAEIEREFDPARYEALNRRGSDLLEAWKPREAIPWFERAIEEFPGVAAPHNNLALARFLCGEVGRAIDVAENAVRCVDSDNLFTLAVLVQLYLFAGRDQEAAEIGTRVENLFPPDAGAAFKQCESLARLRRHEAVYACAAAALRASPPDPALFEFFAGAAAANLGRYDEARTRLRAASGQRDRGPRARRYLECLGRGVSAVSLEGGWPYLEPGDWVPGTMLASFRSDETVRRYPGMVALSVAFLDEFVAEGKEADAARIVESLGALGTPRALEVLRKIASGTYGPDKLRIAALAGLGRSGERPAPGGPPTWLGGKWRETETFGIELTAEAAYPVREDLRAPMEALLEALRAGRWADVEREARGILERDPGNLKAMQNLSAALHHQGREAEGEALLHAIIAADPSYLFAPATLASLRISRGRVEEAREILRNARISPRMHPEAYGAFLGAQFQLAVADGDAEAVANLARTFKNLGLDLEMHAGRAAEAVGVFAKLAEWGPRARTERWESRCRRILALDADLETCLGDRSREELADAARSLGVRTGGLRKARLLVELAAALRQPEAAARSARGLPAPAAEALRALFSAGGALPFDDFTRRFGPRSERGQPPGDPPAALDVLERRALVALGSVLGRATVLVPAEIRASLARALGPGPGYAG